MERGYNEVKAEIQKAENLFYAKEYDESYSILYNIAYFLLSERQTAHLSIEQRKSLMQETARKIGMFTFCEDEALWEKSCELSSFLYSQLNKL